MSLTKLPGNIAVGDEEVIRYCEYLRDVCAKYTEDETVKKKAEEIIHFLRYEKVEGEAEKRDVLFMKGTIRREEAVRCPLQRDQE